MADLITMLSAASGATAEADPNFNSTVLLLHGDGTNGAQNNTFLDSSTNNFTITRNGNTTQGTFSPFSRSSGNLVNAPYDPAVHGGSGYFDGTGDTLTVADNAAFDLGSGDWTIEFWANFNSVSGEKGLVSHFATPALSTGYTLRLSTGNSPSGLRLVCSSGGGTDVILQAAWSPVVSAWYHIAAVRDGGTLRLYVDGVQIGSTSIAITIGNPSTTFAVGTAQTVASSDMNGYISNVRLVKGTCLYTGGTTFTPPTAPLTAISGTSLLCNFTNAGIFDNTGKNNLETVGNAQIDTTTKKYGTGSMEFDGTGDWLYIPDSDNWDFGSGNFTIEFWYNADSLAAFHVLLQQAASTTSRWILYWSATNGMVFDVVSGSVIISVSQGATTGWSTGTWYHVALVRNGNNFAIYRNGTSIASATDSDAIPNYAAPLYIGGGAISGDVSLDGFIDDLRITKGVARYTANFTAPTKAFPDQ